MLVRDGPQGLEVLLQRRTLRAAFVAGAHVFPGGALDPADADGDALGPARGPLDDGTASRFLGVRDGGLAYWLAAIRECFEEAGLLLARHRDGRPLRLDGPDAAARFDAYRRAVHRGELSMAELCEAEQLVLATEELVYVSHWITPEGGPRRFDTRFFAARAPEGQEALHDDVEAIASAWMRPADALAAGRRGDVLLILPTLENLATLAAHATVDDLLTDLRARPAGPRARSQG